jgi:hypothetical protein
MPGTFQADLMDLRKWAKYNKKYKYLLNIVDIYSRYAWSFPLTSKKSTSNDIADKFKQVYDEILKLYPETPLVLEVDNGKEFMGQVEKLNKKYNVEVYLNDPSKITQHTFMSIIERFNRTVLTKINKHFYSRKSMNYIDVLPDIVNAYNNKIHSTIQDTPYNIFINGQRIPIIQSEENKEELFNIGDNVRRISKIETFDKKSITPKLSTQIYSIVDIKGDRYVIQNINGDKPLVTTFIKRELHKIPKVTEEDKKENEELKDFVNKVDKNHRAFMRKYKLTRETGREYDEDNNPVFKERELPTTSKADRKKKAQRKIGNGLNYIEPN